MCGCGVVWCGRYEGIFQTEAPDLRGRPQTFPRASSEETSHCQSYVSQTSTAVTHTPLSLLHHHNILVHRANCSSYSFQSE